MFIQAYYWQVRLACIFALSSFGMTSYILLFIPSTGPKAALFPATTDPRPAQRFVPYMNGLLSLLIGLNGLRWRDRVSAPDGFWVVSWMPLGMISPKALLLFSCSYCKNSDPCNSHRSPKGVGRGKPKRIIEDEVRTSWRMSLNQTELMIIIEDPQCIVK